MLERDCGDGRTGLIFPRLSREAGLRHVYTTRGGDGGGNLSLSGGRDRAGALAERRFWCRSIGVDAEHLTVGGQVHGARVAVVGAGERGRGADDPETVLHETDALVTTEHGLPLFSAAADCAAVLLYAPGRGAGERRAVAVAHAGWRGMRAGVLRAAAAALARAAGVAPAGLMAGVAPCIGPPHYPVGAEVVAAAPRESYRRDDEAWQLDLAAWARAELLAAGLPGTAVELSGRNTAADPRFFSHRRDGAATGRMGLIAALAPAVAPAGSSPA